jgi:hypothetical protein
VAKKYLSDDQLKSKCSFPVPDKGSFRDGKRGQDAILGWEYLEKLAPELAAVARCRVYRLHPKIDMRLIGKSTTDIDVWEGPIKFPSDEYEKHFYHTFGAGAYKVIIEEQGLSGVVCDIWFTLPDTESYPPKIDDRTLLIDAPENKDYLDWRARRGDPVGGKEEKPEPEKPKEDDFMELGTPASPAAMLVGGLVDMAKEQVNQAKNDAREAREQIRGNGAADPITTVAATAAIGMVQEASRELMKNSNAPNPVELVRTIVDMMPKPVPPPDNAPMFNAMMAMQADSSKTMLQMVLNQNAELKQELVQIRQSAMVAPVDPFAKLKEIKDYAELMGFSRTNGASHEPAAPAKSSFEEWGPIIQMAIGVFGPVLTAITQKLAGPPAAPTAPPDYSQQPPQVQQPPPPPPMDPNSPQARQMGLLRMIEKAFIGHLFDANCDGYTFAQWMISGGTGAVEDTNGRALYRDIKANLGMMPDKTCGLDKVIQQYPEIIWNTVKSDKPSYYKFLTEFFNYDEQMAGAPPAAKVS